MLFQRAQCAINVESPGDKLNANLGVVAKELAKVRKEGLSEEEFNALVAQKSLELQKLFATYARADTDILISQRIRSLQNQVVDIAPEQYQKLRQDFLNGLTVEMLNQDLRQQLSQDMALILLQPKGEPEYDMKELKATRTPSWRRRRSQRKRQPMIYIRMRVIFRRASKPCVPRGLGAGKQPAQSLGRHRLARNNRSAILNHRAGR